jgi:hypothetical protein
MISHQHKCIFIHISKCAGSSVENAFGVFRNEPGSLEALRGWDDKHKLYRQHATPQQLLDLGLITKKQWDTYYKFVIYRNSWSKLLSDYSWVSRTHKIEDSFENFLFKKGKFSEILNDNSTGSYCGDHLYYQKDYFYLDGKEIVYDTSIDFDAIENGFNQVINDLGLHPSFFNKKDNITNYEKAHYSHLYSLKSKHLVEKLYTVDIEYFKFKFEKQHATPMVFNSFLRKTI